MVQLMKITLTLFFLFFIFGLSAQVAINSDGSAPSGSAMLDVKSTTRGILPPRMSTAQMNAIAAPPDGLIVYNTGVSALYWYNGSAGTWQRFNDMNFTETDPVFLLHPAHGITTGNISNWNTAFGWGNHALAGYLQANLLQGALFIGNSFNMATGVQMTGDATINTAGLLTLSNTTIVPGTYGASGNNIPNLTFDAKGRATTAANRSLTPADINALNLGGGTMTGNLSMGITNRITDLADPLYGMDAVNMQFLQDFAVSAGNITGTLPVTNGGTGQASLAAGKVMVGNGISPVLTPANLHWDNANSRLGIVNPLPLYTLDVIGDVGWTGTLQSGYVPWTRLSGIPYASVYSSGIVQLSNSYSGPSSSLAVTEYALSAGLATRASSAHTHPASDIVSGVLPVVRGGTNTGSLGSAGKVAYSDGSGYAFTGAGNAGNALVSGGTGAPAWFTPSAGSLIFSAAGGSLSQDNAALFWDLSNDRLGILTSAPSATLSVGASSQFQVASNGAATANVGNTGAAITGSNTNASGTGVVGIGNNLGAWTPPASSGGSFNGVQYGVIGNATGTSQTTYYGGYFMGGSQGWAKIGGYNGATAIKVTGGGSAGTIVENQEGEQVMMFCPEAPEIVFTDYGTGKLSGGRCHIPLDPVFSKNISVNLKNPLKVFIQMEGDCNGVYVTNKSAAGFDVVELLKGTSEAAFSWSVVSTRKDTRAMDGSVVSKHEGVRFLQYAGDRK